MSASPWCVACGKAIAGNHVTRISVVRGFYRDEVLTLDTLETHVDCDDPKGEAAFSWYRRTR